MMRNVSLLLATLLLLAGCGGSEPVAVRAAPLDAGITAAEGDGTDINSTNNNSTKNSEAGSAPVLDMRTTDTSAPGEVAGGSATNPPLTTASIGTPPPPYTLTGAEPTIRTNPTVPTTRPPATSASTAAPTTSPPTTAAPTTAAPAPTTPSTTTAAVTAPPGIVEFRIVSGTQAGPWNSFDNPVRVTVGQTLRIYNDDVVAHTLHSNGEPFEHGRTIEPGQFGDHAIIATFTPDRSAPANYEHDAGVGAPFWVVATAPDQGSAGADGPAELATAEAESLRLLNQLRGGLGLQLVAPSDREMHRFARAWSLEMRNTGFRHSNPPRWFENIVWYSDDTMTPAQAAAQFHDMWVNSPGHYDNMTNPDWSVVGVGMWHDETGWWGVHVFR